MDAIARQKVATEQLVREKSQTNPKILPDICPQRYICKLYILKTFNTNFRIIILLTSFTFISREIISSVLQSNMKNLPRIMQKKVIQLTNVDGSHEKIGLKTFPNFFQILTGAISKLP